MYTYAYMMHHHLQKPTTSATRLNCPAILICLCLQQAVHHFGMSILCSQKQGSCPQLCSKGIKLQTQTVSSFQIKLIMKENKPKEYPNSNNMIFRFLWTGFV